jgi:hypothetical protein
MEIKQNGKRKHFKVDTGEVERKLKEGPRGEREMRERERKGWREKER